VTPNRLARSLSLMLGVAAVWGVPIKSAEARGYHPNPPRQAPAPVHEGSGAESQGSTPQHASSESSNGAPDGCFRRYDDRCKRARQNYRDRQGSGDD
jgi:hypothetical protein